MNQLEQFINDQWQHLSEFSAEESKWIEVRKAVFAVLAHLDGGTLRSAEKINGVWTVHAWVKKAILMSFRLMPNKLIDGFYDKIPLKFSSWSADKFKESKIRAVPGSVVRQGAFIGKNVVLMPSFVNIGAHVDDNTLIDTWATVGSCAQIGKNCHISGGTGIGGVLEPLNASPVIIEDNCFIGARSEIVEGVVVETGAVISMGVYISPSTKILNRDTGEILYGRVPAYSVVVPGTAPSKNDTQLYAAVIIKTVDESTRKKTSLNDLLRS